MTNTVPMAFAGLSGFLLGAFFFGGLWWTVRRCMQSAQPGVCWLGSTLLRMTVAVLGFYVVGRGDWRRLIVCLIGFITARLVVTWLTRPSDDLRVSAARTESHAP